MSPIVSSITGMTHGLNRKDVHQGKRRRWEQDLQSLFSQRTDTVSRFELSAGLFLVFRDVVKRFAAIYSSWSRRRPCFQQNNASIHNTRARKKWSTSQNIFVFDSPFKFRNLHPVENLRGFLARRFYGGWHQYRYKAVLQQFLLNDWQKIELDLLKSLVASIPSRSVGVL